MTYEFEYLFSLLGASAFDNEVEMPKKEIDWGRLLSLAKEQAVFVNVIYALKSIPDAIPDKSRYRTALLEYRSLLVSETIRRDAIHGLLLQLKKRSIPFVVLKGIGLSTLYAVPECRGSADIDIYVGEENEEIAQEVLRENGVTVNARNPICQEAKCYHPDIGLIELHAYLFREEDRKYWFTRGTQFTGVTLPFKTIFDDSEHEIPVLADQDNALFLALHLVKHFIREGISLRNLIDLTLFLKNCKNDFQEQLFWERLKELRFDKIIRAALSSCVYYLSIPEDSIPGFKLLDKETVEQFLDDIEKGGYFGINDPDGRADSVKIYERYVYQKSGVGNISYIWKKRDKALGPIRAALNPKRQILKRYSYARDHRILLPIAWIHYVFDGIKKLVMGERRPVRLVESAAISNVSKERLALFRKLEMM